MRSPYTNHTHTQARTHARTHACTHARTHARTHTHTHTHSLVAIWISSTQNLWMIMSHKVFEEKEYTYFSNVATVKSMIGATRNYSQHVKMRVTLNLWWGSLNKFQLYWLQYIKGKITCRAVRLLLSCLQPNLTWVQSVKETRGDWTKENMILGRRK